MGSPCLIPLVVEKNEVGAPLTKIAILLVVMQLIMSFVIRGENLKNSRVL